MFLGGGGIIGVLQAAKAVMADMRKHNPVLVEEALLVSREMIKVRGFCTWFEAWTEDDKILLFWRIFQVVLRSFG